jgi:integrase/recombinase XerD
MKTLRRFLSDYLQVRRALGYKLARAGNLLADFVVFVEQADSPVITTELALAWATQSVRGSPWWSGRRLGMVRSFAKYVQALDPRTQIPMLDLFPSKRPRRTPYIYSDADVRRLMDLAEAQLEPFKGTTYRTLLGLLASTGIRIGEAIALNQADLDVAQGVLLIRHAKFGKSRWVPLHPSTLTALVEYSHRRDRTFPRPLSPAFFVSLTGTRLHYPNVQVVFYRLVGTAGLAHRNLRRPRIHDLRHAFAVHTLLDWYRTGVDAEARLPWLSTYLGHVSPVHTYWYLTVTPELATLAHRRLEHFLETRS